METWLDRLTQRVEHMRAEGGADRLLVVLDGDGTLLDPRAGLLDLLHGVDRREGGGDFAELDGARLAGRPLVGALEGALDANRTRRARDLCGALLEPELTGGARAALLDLLRWLQLHPGTFLAVGSSRDQARALATLAELRRSGGARGLRFSEDLLLLGPDRAARPAALAGLLARGFRLAAVLDRDGERLAQLLACEGAQGALAVGPAELARLDAPMTLGLGAPLHVVARDLGARDSLATFLGSTANWAEVCVAGDPRGELFARGAKPGEAPIALEEVIGMLAQGGRGLVLSLDGVHGLLPRALMTLSRSGFPERETQFYGSPELWLEGDVRDLVRERAPNAQLGVHLDQRARAWIPGDGSMERELDGLAKAGVVRMAIAAEHPALPELAAWVARRGLALDLDVPLSAETFLAALAHRPAALRTALPRATELPGLDQPAAPFAVRARSHQRA